MPQTTLTNFSGSTFSAQFLIVRSNGVTGQIVPAQADTAGHSAGVLGVCTTTPADSTPGLVVNSGPCWVQCDGAITPGAVVYLSSATAGYGTATAPAIAVPIGVCEKASGTLALVNLGGSFAQSLDYLLLRTAITNIPPNAQNLGALASGILKQTVVAGVATISIAGSGDYVRSITAGTGISNGGTAFDWIINSTGVVSIIAGTNVTISGTGTVTVNAVTGMTTGSVLFAGPSSVVTQDNANLFWDDTNNCLGIGTNVPTAQLHVKLSSDTTPNTITAWDNRHAAFLGGGTPEGLGVSYGGGTGFVYLTFLSPAVTMRAAMMRSSSFEIWTGSLPLSGLVKGLFQDNSANVGVGTLTGAATVLATLSSTGVFGRGTGISLTDGDKGDIVVSSSGTVWTIDTAVVTNANLRNSGPLSVIGRSANSTGVPADISATAASDAVLRESGSVLGFGTVATGGIANSAVTYAKIQNTSAVSVLIGRGSGSGAGVVQEITLGGNLSLSGTVLNTTGIVTSIVAGTNVTVSGSGAITVNAVTGMTTGSVLFSGASSVVTQDNANFFWDSSNHRLGIGNAAPATPLHVTGNSRIDVTNSNVFGGTAIHLKLENPSGSQTLTAYTFAGTLVGGIRADSSGNFNWHASGGQGHQFYNDTAGSVPCASFSVTSTKPGLSIAGGAGQTASGHSLYIQAGTIRTDGFAATGLIKNNNGSAWTIASAGTDYAVSLVAGTGISVSNASGVWTVTNTGGSTAPAGSNTQIQYNNSGAFGASSAHTYDTTNGVLVVGKRFGQAKGANVASANTLTLGTDGNHFVLTGTTTVKGITTANWQAGSRISLHVPSGCTINSGDATPGAGAVDIILAGGANIVGPKTIDLVYDGSDWRQPYDAPTIVYPIMVNWIFAFGYGPSGSTEGTLDSTGGDITWLRPYTRSSFKFLSSTDDSSAPIAYYIPQAYSNVSFQVLCTRFVDLGSGGSFNVVIYKNGSASATGTNVSATGTTASSGTTSWSVGDKLAIGCDGDGTAGVSVDFTVTLISAL